MALNHLTPRGTASKVTISGSHAESAAMDASTKVVRLLATVDCYVAIGVGAVATNASLYMVAGVPEFFGITNGISEVVSVLQVSSGGTLSIAQGARI